MSEIKDVLELIREKYGEKKVEESKIVREYKGVCRFYRVFGCDEKEIN